MRTEFWQKRRLPHSVRIYEHVFVSPSRYGCKEVPTTLRLRLPSGMYCISIGPSCVNAIS